MLTYKKGLLPYKQDLLTYTKKYSLAYTKNPRQILTANKHGKFLRQIPMADSCDKLSRQIATANSCGKFPPQILAANSYDKLLRHIPAANSRGKFPRQILKYAIQKMVWSNPLGGRASLVKIKRKQVTKQKL